MSGPLTSYIVILALVLVPGSSIVLGGEKQVMGGRGSMMDEGHMKRDMSGHMESITSAEIPGMAADQLPESKGEGARLLLRYCTQCHNLPSPATHSAEEWPEVVRRMDGHMETMAGKGHREMMRIKRPTEAERKTIEDYLKKHGLQPFTGETVPDSQSPGGPLFQKICSGCHVLPDIGLHTADEWPDVVDRMRMNMKVLGKVEMSQEERDRIADYLRKQTRGSE